MNEIRSNINIVGGGLIGVFVAYALSKLNYTITILEKKSHLLSKRNEADNRTVAISEGTKNFLEQLGLWKDIKAYSEPILNIKIIDRNIYNQLDFDNRRRSSNLGYIVKNDYLIKILYNNIKKNKNIKILNNININNLEILKESIIIHTNKKKIVSDLNIASDGKNSFVKKIFKTPYFFKNYNKSALVTTFTHSKNHNNTAFEFFYKNGPLAILPMKKTKGNFTSSIVWTNNTEYLKNILNLESEKLISILKKETQLCIGNINHIISKQIFPLSAHINSKFYENRNIYIGDAAHSFHPIAGQGWNLGMKDIQNLFMLSKKYNSLGIDLGGQTFCKQYHDENFYNAFRLYQVTDKLDTIFQIQNPLFYFGRSSGIKFLQKRLNIKNKISDFAMGIS